MAALRLAVVGAGWAGLAGAVAATAAGHDVTLYEMAHVAGGRARSLEVDLPGGGTAMLDNGQHIMVGAYGQTLQMMERVGLQPRDLLHRLPLVLRFPDGAGIELPLWPAPWDALAGIAGARGWGIADKLSLLQASIAWRVSGFQCAEEVTVAQLCASLTARVRAEMIEPLCVSALNTPAQRASGRVFLRVLRDALFGAGWGDWGGSNLLLPRQDLGKLFPDAAWHWLGAHGAQALMGHRVHALAPASDGWSVDGERFDAVLLACPPWEAQRLVAAAGVDAAEWVVRAAALQHESIATVYTLGGPPLPLPLMALRSDAAHPAQFVFDRAQLGAPGGLLAFVVSASEGDRDTLQHQVVEQAHALGWPVTPLQTVVDKRATFACVPGLQRPAAAIAPGLWACGDYVDGPYPATIEGAVRSALAAVASLSATARTTAPGR